MVGMNTDGVNRGAVKWYWRMPFILFHLWLVWIALSHFSGGGKWMAVSVNVLSIVFHIAYQMSQNARAETAKPQPEEFKFWWKEPRR